MDFENFSLARSHGHKVDTCGLVGIAGFYSSLAIVLTAIMVVSIVGFVNSNGAMVTVGCVLLANRRSSRIRRILLDTRKVTSEK